nr:PREDICTED: THAP domain-containing protein 3 [Lepisosteus oculatus]
MLAAIFVWGRESTARKDMPKSCSAYNCTNRYSSKNPDLTFHRFPFSKPHVLKEWLDNIARDDFQPKRHMVICSQHFTPDCFSSFSNRKNLLWNAVPTLFSFPPTGSKRKKSRKKLKTERVAAASKWEELWLEEVGPQQEEVELDCRGEREEPVTTETAESLADRSPESTPQEPWPPDHSYALAEPGEVKTRLFSALEANERLRGRLKVKCRRLRQTSARLRAARRQLGRLRTRLGRARAEPGHPPPTEPRDPAEQPRASSGQPPESPEAANCREGDGSRRPVGDCLNLD